MLCSFSYLQDVYHLISLLFKPLFRYVLGVYWGCIHCALLCVVNLHVFM